MINRENWKLIKAYLEYRKSVDQISNGSLRVEATYLRHILEWAEDTPFQISDRKRPTLPEYMLTARQDDKENPLSPGFIKKTLETSRRLFTWASIYQRGYKRLGAIWINSLKPKRISEPQKNIEAVTLDEIQKIAAAPAVSTAERRIRAAAVFWFLSGIRIGAFVSLPIKTVDIENRVVRQYPNLGVRTKNKKHKKTSLFNIPELLAVVSDWDREVRSILPDNGFWFAPLCQDTGEIDPSCTFIGDYRTSLARRDLKEWLRKVGLPYHAPHKFRHGFTHYGRDNAKSIADFKAVSENLMHASMGITDVVYSQMNDDEIGNRIGLLGNDKNSESEEDTYILFREFLAWRKGRK
jgi:integrase